MNKEIEDYLKTLRPAEFREEVEEFAQTQPNMAAFWDNCPDIQYLLEPPILQEGLDEQKLRSFAVWCVMQVLHLIERNPVLLDLEYGNPHSAAYFALNRLTEVSAQRAASSAAAYALIAINWEAHAAAERDSYAICLEAGNLDGTQACYEAGLEAGSKARDSANKRFLKQFKDMFPNPFNSEGLK